MHFRCIVPAICRSTSWEASTFDLWCSTKGAGLKVAENETDQNIFSIPACDLFCGCFRHHFIPPQLVQSWYCLSDDYTLIISTKTLDLLMIPGCLLSPPLLVDDFHTTKPSWAAYCWRFQRKRLVHDPSRMRQVWLSHWHTAEPLRSIVAERQARTHEHKKCKYTAGKGDRWGA